MSFVRGVGVNFFTSTLGGVSYFFCLDLGGARDF